MPPLAQPSFSLYPVLSIFFWHFWGKATFEHLSCSAYLLSTMMIPLPLWESLRGIISQGLFFSYLLCFCCRAAAPGRPFVCQWKSYAIKWGHCPRTGPQTWTTQGFSGLNLPKGSSAFFDICPQIKVLSYKICENKFLVILIFFSYYFVIYILSMPGIKLLPKPIDHIDGSGLPVLWPWSLEITPQDASKIPAASLDWNASILGLGLSYPQVILRKGVAVLVNVGNLFRKS